MKRMRLKKEVKEFFVGFILVAAIVALVMYIPVRMESLDNNGSYENNGSVEISLGGK